MRALLFGLSLCLWMVSAADAAKDKVYGMKPDRLISMGAKYLSRSEVVNLLKGRTELWDTGGKAFYGAGGKLSLRFRDGVRAEGSWKVSGNGTMCTKVSAAIPGSNYCHRYIRYNGKVYYVWLGKVTDIHRTGGGKAF
jgi:hypothetical protein